MMLSVEREVCASPSAAWRVLVDLDAWPTWGPSVRSARLDPPHTELALGATGTVRTALGVSLPFVITEFEPGRRWSWTVAGVPATRHWVEPQEDDTRARIGMAVPWWSAPYATVCAVALRRIDAMLTG
jgi:hypothetical protein